MREFDRGTRGWFLRKVVLGHGGGGTCMGWYAASESKKLGGYMYLCTCVQLRRTTSINNQDPVLWGFWIMSSPSSRFLVLLHTVDKQAIPTLWGFWTMSRRVSCMLVVLCTTTRQPNPPTSYLPTCRIRRWVGRLARTLRAFQLKAKSKVWPLGPWPLQVGNDGNVGPLGYVQGGRPAPGPILTPKVRILLGAWRGGRVCCWGGGGGGSATGG